MFRERMEEGDFNEVNHSINASLVEQDDSSLFCFHPQWFYFKCSFKSIRFREGNLGCRRDVENFMERFDSTMRRRNSSTIR